MPRAARNEKHHELEQPSFQMNTSSPSSLWRQDSAGTAWPETGNRQTHELPYQPAVARPGSPMTCESEIAGAIGRETTLNYLRHDSTRYKLPSQGKTMGFLQLANFAVACNTSRDVMAKANSTGKPRRSRVMLSAWRLDAADDPTILFASVPDRLNGGRNSVVEAHETEERLWARHQAWDM
jgi:hypothetical protein